MESSVATTYPLTSPVRTQIGERGSCSSFLRLPVYYSLSPQQWRSMAFLDDGRMKVPLPPCSSHHVTDCFSVPLDSCHCTHYPLPMLPARFPSSIRSRAGTSSRLWRIHQEMFLCKVRFQKKILFFCHIPCYPMIEIYLIFIMAPSILPAFNSLELV